MLSEINIGGVYLAPIVIEGLLGLVIFALCRFVLGRLGVLSRIWHPALFEVCLFLSIVSLLVLLR
ncbi:DUF1656 domain-containing protein [Roseomonas gilardii]|uniref:DUF1656 domain-containing protein n=1 Tax=Roseomonas gilardii TaxID=257708 RepID=A0A1L7ACN1_9PROT|nr:DUF1656 domain-containing protein [Roseomonas gilardii]APT56558.1 hypothetical protein RGI145_04995 [Roseomonas gilardii]MDT8331204.1 DUF1656 domain-containing protein [Roseomonas gilardii]PZR15740.1 MAG: DUF1656 domain-containing protein [Azospirillum brasilense]